jgi:DNA-directed RNA polymerase specialized sigma24 family protein
VTEFLNENPKPVNQEALEQEELVLPEEDLQDLSILTDAEQAIVELHQKEGFSFERIAQLFDLSASEIAKIYSAALELMQNS